MPARVARRKPFCSSLSANTTVSFRPHLRKEVLISLQISFFFRALLMFANARPLGRISDSRARPGGGRRPAWSRARTRRVSLSLTALGQAHADLGGQLDHAGCRARAASSATSAKIHALALAVDALAGGVVQAQHHVLRGHDRRFARGREQHVVGGQHQGAGFHLGFDATAARGRPSGHRRSRR